MLTLARFGRRSARANVAVALLATAAHAGITLSPGQKSCITETTAAIAEAKRADLEGQHTFALAQAPDHKALFDALLAMDLATLEVQRLKIDYLAANFPSDSYYDPAQTPVFALQGALKEPMLIALEKDPSYMQAVETLANATYEADKLGGRERAGYLLSKAPPNPEQQTAALEAGNRYYELTDKVCGP